MKWFRFTILLAILILIALLVHDYASGTTRAQIIDKFRARTGEQVKDESYYTDSTAVKWANMAQQKIVRLGGYIERFADFTPAVDSAGSSRFTMPTTFRELVDVQIRTDGRWYNALPFGIIDTNLFQYSLVWKKNDTAFLYLIDGWKEKAYTFEYNPDSAYYTLPSDARDVLGIMLRSENEWRVVIPNPYFVRDTVVPQYFLARLVPDRIALYLRGNITLGDSLTVFYKGPRLGGADTVRVVYKAGVADMNYDTSTCQIPTDLEPFLIEEMMSYYEYAKRSYDVWQAVWNQVRNDMAIVRRGGFSATPPASDGGTSTFGGSPAGAAK